MHASLESMISEAEAAMATDRASARALVLRRANELERAHLRALGAHRKTLNAMKRDGVSAPDLLITIGRLRAIAARPLVEIDEASDQPLFEIAARSLDPNGAGA